MTTQYRLDGMARDTNKAHQEAKDRAIQEEINKLIGHITGQTVPNNQGFAGRFGW
jgi:hypothetical protein